MISFYACKFVMKYHHFGCALSKFSCLCIQEAWDLGHSIEKFVYMCSMHFFSVFEDVPVPVFCVKKPTCTVSDHSWYKACLIMFDPTCQRFLPVFNSPRQSCEKKNKVWNIGICPVLNSPAVNEGENKTGDWGGWANISLYTVIKIGLRFLLL